MLVGALESQGLHPRLMHHELPAHGAVLRDWGTSAWGDIRVLENELEEARLILDDFREALARMAPLREEDGAPESPAEPAADEPHEKAHLQEVPPPDIEPAISPLLGEQTEAPLSR